MSDTIPPTMYDAPTRAVDRTYRLARAGAEFDRRVARAVVNSMDGQRAVQRRALTLAGLALEQPMLVAAALAPENSAALGDLEATYEEGVASVEALGDDWWDAYTRTMTDGVEAYAAVTEAYEGFLDAWYRTAMRATDRAATAANGPPRDPVVVDVEGGEGE